MRVVVGRWLVDPRWALLNTLPGQRETLSGKNVSTLLTSPGARCREGLQETFFGLHPMAVSQAYPTLDS